MTRVRVTEASSARIVGTITDPDGELVSSGLLTDATLTLYDQQTEAILNERDAQDVLGVGSPIGDHGVSLFPTLQTDDDGTTYNFEWLMEPADNVIVTERRQMERHRALFQFVWPTGESITEFEIEVHNVRKASADEV